MPEASYQIRTESFEGPFDLLLYLVKNSKININDLSISEITGQFLDHIAHAHPALEVISEFVFTAAQLLYLKSRVLLPRENLAADEEEPDTRREYVDNLIEYQTYRQVSRDLHRRIEQERVLLRRDQQLVIDFKDDENWEEITILDLVMAFSRVARGIDSTLFRSLEMETISIEDKIDEISNMLLENESVLFASLFTSHSNRYTLIITFLALLELVKMKRIFILQHKLFGSIKIQRREIG